MYNTKSAFMEADSSFNSFGVSCNLYIHFHFYFALHFGLRFTFRFSLNLVYRCINFKRNILYGHEYYLKFIAQYIIFSLVRFLRAKHM